MEAQKEHKCASFFYVIISSIFERKSVMKKLLIIIIVVVIAGACVACSDAPVQDTSENIIDEIQRPLGDSTYLKQEGIDVIYLAGGCFWGIEKLIQVIPGVAEATSGYSNGIGEDPTYEYVLSGTSDYRETVRVEYDPEIVSLDMILFTFFASIDPTIKNKQGNDVGSQYQSGIYYVGDESKATVERIATVERGRYDPFAVEISPLMSFFDAEEYHQDYLSKNINGYCHISSEAFELAANMIVDPADYPRPSDEEIKATLNKEQYNITQNALQKC